MTTTRFDQKIARMRAGTDTPADFIIADAKDADMAAGLSATGGRLDGGSNKSRYRTLAEYEASIKSIIDQDIVDIMLTSALVLDDLMESGAFSGSAVKPAIRANDTTDLWRGRGMSYTDQPSLPHRTAALDGAHTDLGLYSMTFNGVASEDRETLDAFHAFRDEAADAGFSYFLEVFNPNLGRIAPDEVRWFMNDSIGRTLAGLRRSERPIFLKVPYNGPDAFEELCSFDTSLIVGVMGGGAGTTRDCFELLHQSQKYGGRAALFGRKINEAENPLSMIQSMRLVTDGELSPAEATRFYHDSLSKSGISPLRSQGDDLTITESSLLHATA